MNQKEVSMLDQEMSRHYKEDEADYKKGWRIGAAWQQEGIPDFSTESAEFLLGFSRGRGDFVRAVIECRDRLDRNRRIPNGREACSDHQEQG